MKHLITFFGVVLAMIIDMNAIGISDSSRIIGVHMYHTTSESGYGSSLNLNVSIERERRHLEIGIIMQYETSSISGGEIQYKKYFSSFLTKDISGQDRFRNIRVYFQYNFIFRQCINLYEFNAIPTTLSEGIYYKGRIATFEHYTGIGAQLKIFDKFFINSSICYGVILGSIDSKYQGVPHYTLGGRKNDFGFLVKFGVGYFLVG